MKATSFVSLGISRLWESKGGNSFPPPITVPNYIQVIVATAIDLTMDIIARVYADLPIFDDMEDC